MPAGRDVSRTVPEQETQEDMSRISELVGRIQGVRDYTVSLVDAVPESEWFRQPAEGVTHVAWQVGHLAMAQYRLALDRVRGVQPGDEDLISEQVLSIYGKDSVPDPDPAANATPAEIRAAFDAAGAPAGAAARPRGPPATARATRPTPRRRRRAARS